MKQRLLLQHIPLLHVRYIHVEYTSVAGSRSSSNFGGKFGVIFWGAGGGKGGWGKLVSSSCRCDERLKPVAAACDLEEPLIFLVLFKGCLRILHIVP